MNQTQTRKTRLKKPWKKVLYEKQDYPDNYTDQNIFLKDLKKNIYLREVTLIEACIGANRVLQEFCAIVLFSIIYIYIVNQQVESWIVLYGMSSISFLGFVFYRVYFQSCSKNYGIGYDIRTILTFIAFGQLFSPVLHTLTDTISTDTIHTMAFLMLLIHLIFFDFEVPAALVSRSLSLSAAIFASICLASRLSSASEAFVLLTVSTQIFVLSPILRKELHHPVILTVILLILDVYFLKILSNLLAVLFVACVVLINFICPMLFVKYQKYKDNIYGPWDEAVVKDIDKVVY
ncbi:phosphatidylinositol N-acetylglucosaminyltransferase subunit C [Anthonomus grandis grandis]|uniref:phosphatidylinositol N-acetylglucosaminyltransferase subunit C n=1 Tax=Anthonomus grandis grandis TaxID=2921223 RepID=UPI002165F779|nr:phosphatidylinositol N-acetylglucosaminyltransferase subunit C [Anthonomus grandis grandis]